MKIKYEGAGCLVFHKDNDTGEISLLLGLRQSGVWSIPGGGREKVDLAQTEEQTAKNNALRELEEELRIKVRRPSVVRRIKTYKIPFFRFDIFGVRLAHKITITKWTEFRRVRWFSINELSSIKLHWLVNNELDSLIEYMNRKNDSQ